MSAFNYNELKRHVGHDIVCVSYGDGVNVAVECEDCNEVLLDYDKDDSDQMDQQTIELLENNLNQIITECLYSPKGDPIGHELRAAALAYKALKILNLKVEDEEGISDELTKDNIYEENFLD